MYNYNLLEIAYLIQIDNDDGKKKGGKPKASDKQEADDEKEENEEEANDENAEITALTEEDFSF